MPYSLGVFFLATVDAPLKNNAASQVGYVFHQTHLEAVRDFLFFKWY